MSSSKMRYLIPALVLLIGATALIIGSHLSKKTDQPSPETTLTPLEQAAVMTATTPEQNEPTSAQPDGPTFTPVLQPTGRFIGNEDAPVHMIEFASLSCNHCAFFHNKILDEFRVKYVDTGKVRIEFRSFPLNQQALDGLKLLNCLPEDQFYPFMTMLYQTQDHWAFDKNYKDLLKQNAKLAGLSDDKIDFCLNDKKNEEDLVNGLVQDIQKYKLQSTPTFVLNDGVETIVGAESMEELAKKIDPLLDGTAAPATPLTGTETPPPASAQ